MCIHMYVYIYIYIYIVMFDNVCTTRWGTASSPGPSETEIGKKTGASLYMCRCIHVYIYIYIYV